MKQPNQVLLETLPTRSPKTPLERFSTLVWLQSKGICVPPFGRVRELYKKFNSEDPCVVWTHNGNLMMTLLEAFTNHENEMAAMHVGQIGSVSVSVSIIQIGTNSYWVDYASTNDWRSTHGKSYATLSRVQYDTYHPVIDLPLFSIDYVPANESRHKVYAIDFNRNPGIRGTGIEKVLNPKHAKKLIRAAMRHYEAA